MAPALAKHTATCPLHGGVQPIAAGGRLKCPNCGQFLARHSTRGRTSHYDEPPASPEEVDQILDDNEKLEQGVQRLKEQLTDALASAEWERRARERVELDLVEAKFESDQAKKERADQARTALALSQQVAVLQARVDRLRQNPLSNFFEG